MKLIATRATPAATASLAALLSGALYLSAPSARAIEPATAPALSAERLFESPDLSGDRPRKPQLSPDGTNEN